MNHPLVDPNAITAQTGLHIDARLYEYPAMYGTQRELVLSHAGKIVRLKIGKGGINSDLFTDFLNEKKTC